MTGAESGSPLNIGLCWADIPAGKAYQPATEYVYGALGGARTGVWAVDTCDVALSFARAYRMTGWFQTRHTCGQPSAWG